MIKDFFNNKKELIGLNSQNFKVRGILSHRRWIVQLLLSFVLLTFVFVVIYAEMPGSKVIQEYLAYYLLEQESDWTPAIKTMVNTGLWLDSYDRQVYEEHKKDIEEAQKKTGNMVLPVSGKFVREFGWINSPVDKNKIFYPGIDIATEVGAPVRATADGVVLEIWLDEKIGRSIKIQHSENLTTIYGYCEEILVSNGQQVKGGQIIAKSGKGSSGGRIHFQVRKNGEPIDPLTVLSPLDSKI